VQRRPDLSRARVVQKHEQNHPLKARFVFVSSILEIGINIVLPPSSRSCDPPQIAKLDCWTKKQLEQTNPDIEQFNIHCCGVNVQPSSLLLHFINEP